MFSRSARRCVVFAIVITSFVGSVFAQREKPPVDRQPEKAADEKQDRSRLPRDKGTAPDPSVKTAALKLDAGKSLRHNLPGTTFNDVVSIMVLKDSKRADEVEVSLGSPNRGGRLISIQAGSKASGEYALIGVMKNRKTIPLPIRLFVTASPASRSDNVYKRPDVTENRKPTPKPRPTPRPTRPEPKPEPRPEPAETVEISLAPGKSTQRIVSGGVFESVREVQIFRDGQPTTEVRASLRKTSRGLLLTIGASSNADADRKYAFAGTDSSGRLMRLPILLTLTSSGAARPPVNDRPVGRIPVIPRTDVKDDGQADNEFLPALTKMVASELRSYPLDGARYEKLTAVEVLHRGRVTGALRAGLSGRGDDKRLVLRTQPNAPAAEYHVMGLAGRQPILRLVTIHVTSPSGTTPNNTQSTNPRDAVVDTNPAETVDRTAQSINSGEDESDVRMITLRAGRSKYHTLWPQVVQRIDSVRVVKDYAPTDDISVKFGLGNYLGMVKMKPASFVDPNSFYELQGMKDGDVIETLALLRIHGGNPGSPPDVGPGDDSGEPVENDPGYNNPDPDDNPADPSPDDNNDPGGDVDNGGIDLGDPDDAEPGDWISDPGDLYAESPVRLNLSSQIYTAQPGTMDIPVQIERNGYAGSMYLVCFRNDFPLLPPGQAAQVAGSLFPAPNPDNGAAYSNNTATIRITVASNVPVGEVREFRIEGSTTTDGRMTIPATEFSIQVAAAPTPQPTDPGTDPDTPSPVASKAGEVWASGSSNVLSSGTSYLDEETVAAFYDVDSDGLADSYPAGSNTLVYPRTTVINNDGSWTLYAGRKFHQGSDVVVFGKLNWSSVNREQFVVAYFKRQGNSVLPVAMWAGDFHNNAPLPTGGTVQGIVMNTVDGNMTAQIEMFRMPSGNDLGQIKGVATGNLFFGTVNETIYGETVSFAFDCPLLSD